MLKNNEKRIDGFSTSLEVKKALTTTQGQALEAWTIKL